MSSPLITELSGGNTNQNCRSRKLNIFFRILWLLLVILLARSCYQLTLYVDRETPLPSDSEVTPTQILAPRDLLENYFNCLLLLLLAYTAFLPCPINIFYTVNIVHILGDGNSAHQAG